MRKYSFSEHLTELKNRLFKAFIFFTLTFAGCFYFSDFLYQIILSPLIEIQGQTDQARKIIYTGLTEAFFSHIKIAFFFAFIFSFPFFAFQLYRFILPGLKGSEAKIIGSIFILSPMLFYAGSLFMFYVVMPSAWMFFLQFEGCEIGLPLVLEAKISEYLDLVVQLTLAFGLSFQLPVAIIIFSIMGLVKSSSLASKRRFAVVIIFIIAAIFTPPDIFSQIVLAIPLILLYETSILLCKLIENKEKLPND